MDASWIVQAKSTAHSKMTLHTNTTCTLPIFHSHHPVDSPCQYSPTASHYYPPCPGFRTCTAEAATAACSAASAALDAALLAAAEYAAALCDASMAAPLARMAM